MVQLEHEAHGALETHEISKLFTCVQAAEVPNDCHSFATTWSEQALCATGFDPVPPPKAPRTARPGSHHTDGSQRNPNAPAPSPRAAPAPRGDAGAHRQTGVGAAHAASHRAHRAGGGEGAGRGGGSAAGSRTPTRAHCHPTAGASSPRSQPGTSERKVYLKADDTEVAPVMRHLEQRTHLEKAALEAEYARLMAHGDGALTARARLESGVNARGDSTGGSTGGKSGGSTCRKSASSAAAIGSTYIDAQLQVHARQ